MIVHVRQDDIDNAIHGNGRFCPVALALHRQGFRDPTVTPHEIKLPTGEYWPLPPQVSRAVRLWDGDDEHPPRAPAPFVFHLGTVPDSRASVA